MPGLIRIFLPKPESSEERGEEYSVYGGLLKKSKRLLPTNLSRLVPVQNMCSGQCEIVVLSQVSHFHDPGKGPDSLGLAFLVREEFELHYLSSPFAVYQRQAAPKPLASSAPAIFQVVPDRQLLGALRPPHRDARYRGSTTVSPGSSRSGRQSVCLALGIFATTFGWLIVDINYAGCSRRPAHTPLRADIASTVTVPLIDHSNRCYYPRVGLETVEDGDKREQQEWHFSRSQRLNETEVTLLLS